MSPDEKLFSKKTELVRAIFNERMYYRGVISKYFILFFSFIGAVAVHYFYFRYQNLWPIDVDLFVVLIVIFMTFFSVAGIELIKRAYERNKIGINDIYNHFESCKFGYVDRIWNPGNDFVGHVMMARVIVAANVAFCIFVFSLSELKYHFLLFCLIIFSMIFVFYWAKNKIIDVVSE